jgi:hypothetical protein
MHAGMNQAEELETFVRQNAASLPSTLFNVNEWMEIISAAGECRKVEGWKIAKEIIK